MSFLLLFIFISTTDALSKTAPNITAFLTFRVNSPKLVHTTGRLMEKIKEFDPRLEKFTTNLEKLHITIDVYHVDERNIESSINAMKDLKNKLCKLPKNVVFNGTDMFPKRVLFGNLTETSFDNMKKIEEVSKATFEEHGIKSLNQYNYHPHMTIVELPSDEQELGKKLEAFKGHRLIGRQKFTEIFLCSMGTPHRGFYKIISQQFIGHCEN